MKEKLNHLQIVRGIIDEDKFRFAAATILIDYYLDEMKNKGKDKDMTRTNLLDRVNLSLRSMGNAEVSYGFIRRWFE
ncbi:hypothetical protein [Peribacillus frigoritolerans]|uniref:hypothetical protein n=1 Tax=Peribacillus frigoritolerans TaxID=450367 RepID=UPI0020BD6FF3|nr:hypothetical protein [Peribacillus frigoritolerans]